MSEKRSVRLEELIPVMNSVLEKGHSVTFSPKGISMLPMLREGKDRVTLSPLPAKLKKYDLPLYRREDGRYVLHRVVAVGETYTCIGDNQFQAEPGIDHAQMIAVVTEFTRDGRRYSVDSYGYRLYCCFWHYTRPIRRIIRGIKTRMKRLLPR